MNFKNSSIIIRQDDKSNICLKDGGVTMEKKNIEVVRGGSVGIESINMMER